ncbi:hypothetical protein AAFC00_002210 [Neodothiora populina]|uniref:UDENN domain-containing protein n=1 Tax=Neodothiora populina TaxID=2781224 RepID=A0ABR3PGN4_9PEZI
MTSLQQPFKPVVCVVDFHHARGPETEFWVGTEGSDPAADNDWHLLPFLALSDGAHASTEDFSYFTLVQKSSPARSLFGISCTRQLDSSTLKHRAADVTRSTVQKAVVVITESPQTFSAIREKLSVVTRAWFSQRDFTDLDILQRFQESLSKDFAGHENEGDQYYGLSLRELVHHFKWQTLVLFKCLILQPKMLFFGSQCERLCQMQFSLVSLIPGLLKHLEDCADPQMDSYAQNLSQPTSLRTSERASLLAYMGLPLQIFGKGALFGPYTPLQLLDTLADQETKSYLVGSTNQLLLQQRDHYADVLVNLDDNTINIFSPSLRNALTLTNADRRWADFLTQAVQDTWDPDNPSRPKDMGYAGSEDFIRLQFEEYLLAFVSCVKYRQYVEAKPNDERALLSEVEGNPSSEFGNEFVNSWLLTENYALFKRCTDSHLFDIIEPRHPCAGGLTMEDVQRRLAQQVHELGLDERYKNSKEAIGRGLANGQQRVSGVINNLWADIEAMREAQRKRAAEQKAAAEQQAEEAAKASVEIAAPPQSPKPDAEAQETVQAASSRAAAYLSSWSSWAAEKRKQGWRKSDTSPAQAEEEAAAKTSVEEPSRPAVTTVSELAKTEGKEGTEGTENKEGTQ